MRGKIFLWALMATLLLGGQSCCQMAVFEKIGAGNDTSEPVLVMGTSTEPQGLLPSVKRVQFRTETGWSSWISLKGVRLTTEPVAVSPEPGVVDIFTGGNDNELWQIRLRSHDSWSDWIRIFGPPPYNKNLGGVHFRKYELAAVTTGSPGGDYHLFTWGPTNHCLYKGCWGSDGRVACDRTLDWIQIEGEVGSRPSAVLHRDKIHLFALDSSGGLVWNSADIPATGSRDVPSWGGWSPLRGGFASPPAVATDGEAIHIFALMDGGGLGHLSFDPETGDLRSETISLRMDSSPAVVIEGGRIDLFGVRGDELIHVLYDGEAWLRGENLRGFISGQPTAVSDGRGQIWVFARGQGGWLWGIHYAPG
ncbi:MAG: conserved exported protein of unknown function [Methanothrix sp.]|nr:MAG: conserved exported protein of unknown function [Methanothrix sp.]